MSLEVARKVADAVLYEGYLLYPYRATSRKNQVRWQFGVLGPAGAAEAGTGEESTMSAECLVRPQGQPRLSVHVRFLQLQTRSAEALQGSDFVPVSELAVDDSRWLTWDEAVECEQRLGPFPLDDDAQPIASALEVPEGREVEDLRDSSGALRGRLVRERQALSAALRVAVAPVGDLLRVRLTLDNSATAQPDKDAAIGVSFIGTHLLLQLDTGEFVSTVDPPEDAMEAAADCRQHRWWPVLAGPEGDSQVLLVSPIIIEDHAQLAPESAGALFDSTEIDEILTLRVMTLTDEEKAEARATDPRAAEIIDRCDAMTPEQLQALHGVLRHPHGIGAGLAADPFSGDPSAIDTSTADGPTSDPFALPDELTWTTDIESDTTGVFTPEAPWWDPEADASVAPATDVVVIRGVDVRKDSLVTVHPNRRADAQDIFFTGMTARVAAVLSDVDGDTHVAVTLVDDPAAELHDWYGRYLYFAPDELQPVLDGTGNAGTPEGEHT